MTTAEKLAAILAAVQTDPGQRGLAHDPHDNLFTATAGDFAAACQSIAATPVPHLVITTGFYIPWATPPAYETDGPLGTLFLSRALTALGGFATLWVEPELESILHIGWREAGYVPRPQPLPAPTHRVWIERVGPATDGRYYSMRGRDVTAFHAPAPAAPAALLTASATPLRSLGIGDGGNEIGMGKIPHTTMVKNIPLGAQIHCRIPTDDLLVCGVSNWGAYAVAAGLFLLRQTPPPRELFDPAIEQQILEAMVREGPLVDGVTGQATATVDGLSWEQYIQPLIRIRELLDQ
ncbi:MAG: DUF4392 domain-containing protein [Gemmataceae bacterium]|nr:DUF4392 domain-containing protein [Gemmata sp.]MDW8196629.1 DUF4392 domain-containing protein [Gemmataceae bacterium]